MLIQKIVEDVLIKHFVENEQFELLIEEGKTLFGFNQSLSKDDVELFLKYFHINNDITDKSNNQSQTFVHKLFFPIKEHSSTSNNLKEDLINVGSKSFLNLKVTITKGLKNSKTVFSLYIQKISFKQPKIIPLELLTFPDNNYQGNILIVGKNSDFVIKNQLKTALSNYFSLLDIDLSIDNIKDMDDFDNLVGKKQNRISICELTQHSKQFSEMMKRLESLTQKDVEKYPIHLARMLIFFERVKKVIFIDNVEKNIHSKEYLVRFSYLDFTQNKQIIEVIRKYLQDEKNYYLAKNIKENGLNEEIERLSFSQRIKDYDELKTESFETLNKYFDSLNYKNLSIAFPY